MILISHRGNINGVDRLLENTTSYIMDAISLGYDVEIDLWYVDNKLYLGHDFAQYEISYEFINQSNLWIHCKNIEALEYLTDVGNCNNFFYHQEDDVTLTSKGILWTYPGKKLTKHSIAVLPEFKKFENINISYGICSDFIEKYK